MKNVDLSIIIVNYNTQEFIRECLESIQKNVSDKITHEVIVVDNASTDDSVQFVSVHFPKVHLVSSTQNLGFSKANNVGVKKSRGRYVLFLNPDTVIYKNTLEKMVEFMDGHDQAGASTCYLEMPSGNLDDAAHRGFPTPWNSLSYFSGLAKLFPHSQVFNGYNLGWRNLNKIHEIDALAGAFMMVRRKAGEEVGWWDEDYFFYGEDLDFCYQLKNPSASSGRESWKIYFNPEVKILHYKGVSGGIKSISKKITTASEETKVRSTLARFEAMKIFYKKNYMEKYPRILTWLVFQGITAKRWLTIQSM